MASVSNGDVGNSNREMGSSVDLQPCVVLPSIRGKSSYPPQKWKAKSLFEKYTCRVRTAIKRTNNEIKLLDKVTA